MNLNQNDKLIYAPSEKEIFHLATCFQLSPNKNNGLYQLLDGNFYLKLIAFHLAKNKYKSACYDTFLKYTQTPLLTGEESLLIGYSLLLVGKVVFLPLPLLTDKTISSTKTFLGDKTGLVIYGKIALQINALINARTSGIMLDIAAFTLYQSVKQFDQSHKLDDRHF